MVQTRSDAMKEEQRRGERHRLAVDVMFRKPREVGHEVALRNLSRHGCQLSIRERMSTGQLVWVTLPGLESLYGWIRWSSEWQAGVEFHKVMHPAVFDHLAGQLGRGRMQAGC
jgi:hypothetical protein